MGPDSSQPKEIKPQPKKQEKPVLIKPVEKEEIEIVKNEVEPAVNPV